MNLNDSSQIVPQDPPLEVKQVSGLEPVSDPRQALIEILGGGKNKKYVRFAMAAIGSIPWFGPLLNAMGNLSGALSGLSAEAEQDRINMLLALWIEEHRKKIEILFKTLEDIFSRFENFGEEIQARIESPEYLTLVRRAFTSWDQADTEEKRQMYKRLIINAGATALCEDDLVRLFISWIDSYHEAHFKVIREFFNNPDGITRGQVWDNINKTTRPTDDSSKAGLYSYLTHQLNLGGIISLEKVVTESGRILKKQTPKTSSSPSRYRESPFEDTKPYYLTELGKEFVHYVMKDAAKQIGSTEENKTN